MQSIWQLSDVVLPFFDHGMMWVTRAECERIAAGLRQVMLRSIETGGSSISD